MKILVCLLAATALSYGQAEWKNLWPKKAPGGTPPPAGTEENINSRISKIETPQYSLYLADRKKANGAAVVIFPGGGYAKLAAGHEGKQYADWLNDRGFTAIVVKYRVYPEHDYQYPIPFLDARRAIRTARANSEKWDIDPDKIGVMGSSAGGHLASLCATRFKDTFPQETSDEIDQLSARPDFAILCYPVIIMNSPLGHGGSANNLAGKGAPEELLDKLSTNLAVSEDTPPVFLLSTADDWVDCRNSLLFATSLKEHNIPFALHLFEKGGHGYGLNGKGNLASWPELLDAWLKMRVYD